MTEPVPSDQIELTKNKNGGTMNGGHESSSDDDNISKPMTFRDFLVDLMTQENDLAGFNIIWALGTVVLIIMKIIYNDEDIFKAAGWANVLVTPLCISLLTWIFSYAISKYRKENSVEAMNKRRFLIPLFLKMFLTTFLFGRYIFAKGGLMRRFNKGERWNDWCLWSLIASFVSYFLATLTTEIMITTVMVNSSQNMRQDINIWWKIFLFIARPTLWIYNRIIVMFITYYSFYLVTLGVGPICASQCQVEPAKLHTLGIVMLLQPISHTFYLFKFKNFHFDLEEYDVIDANATPKWKRWNPNSADELMLVVIQQTILAATIIDLCISLWSLFKIMKEQWAKKHSNQTVVHHGHDLTDDDKPTEFNKVASQTPVPLTTNGSESTSMIKNFAE